MASGGKPRSNTCVCVSVCDEQSQTAVEYQTEYYNISVYRVLKPLTHTWPLTADITAPSLPPVGVNPRWCYSCTAAEAEEMKRESQTDITVKL